MVEGNNGFCIIRNLKGRMMKNWQLGEQGRTGGCKDTSVSAWRLNFHLES